MLLINGRDSNGYSYFQKQGDDAMLTVGAGGSASGNIRASGKYQINTGTVQLTAPIGGVVDELDGVGMSFLAGDVLNYLTIVDQQPGSGGIVKVQGPLTLYYNDHELLRSERQQ